MSLEEEQKGIFPFHVDTTEQQPSAYRRANKPQIKSYPSKRASENGEEVKMPHLPRKCLTKFKVRHKSDSFADSIDKNQENKLDTATQLKQKNKTRIIGQKQNFTQNIKYQHTRRPRPNQQYSNAFDLKAHLEALKTHKKITSQQNICDPELKSLSMRKNLSQQDVKHAKDSKKFRVLRLQTIGSQIQKPEELIKKETMNYQLKKKAYFMTKSKKLLHSKMKEVKRIQQILPTIQQNQAQELLRSTHFHQSYTKRADKKYKRVNNPIKRMNQPYLQPLSNHKIKPFRQYSVNIQQICGLSEITRDSHNRQRFSQNVSTFAAQRQVDCIKLIFQLRKVRHS